MKLTYLVFDETTQGRLRVATTDEWKRIMEQNAADDKYGITEDADE